VLHALAGNLEFLKPAIEDVTEDKEEEVIEASTLGLKFLDGANIITHPDGAAHTLDDLRVLDMVGIYFSAHWCPPCRKFTPLLAGLFKEITATGKTFGIVFVSSDKNQTAFLEYFRKMPWVALDYAQRDLQEAMSEAFQVDGIPALVLVDPKTGKFTTKGDEKVALGAAAFPWPL
jgi:nucleoredoxin